MTPRSLFLIVLKCMGLVFIKDLIYLMPSFLSSFYFLFDPGTLNGGLLTVTTYVIILGIYFLLIYFLLFKASWIIDKLKLGQSFEQEQFNLNIHRSSILSIIIVVTGLLIVVRAAPTLCGQVLAYFATKWGNSGQTSYDMQGALVTAIQLIIGLLMIGTQRQIVNFIERKRRNTSLQGDQI